MAAAGGVTAAGATAAAMVVAGMAVGVGATERSRRTSPGVARAARAVHVACMLSYSALRARFLEDRQSGGATPRLAAALESVGWRSVGDPSPEELASYLVDVVDACVSGHRDTSLLVSAVAHVLRDHGPLLDGGLPPAAAYEPAAMDVLERYVRGDAPRRVLPGFGDG